MAKDKEVEEQKVDEKTLVPLNTYLSSGIHIGMKQRVKAMSRYIYKVRSDKLAVFNVQMIDKQLETASKMLSRYKPEEILVVSRKKNGFKPAVKFAESIGGANVIYGRFYPGTLTNQQYKKYAEPKVLVVTDPFLDKQAVKEAVDSHIPIIGLCDTFNDPKNLDLVISMNNKGRKSLALAYWVIAKEIMKLRGEIKGDAEFKFSLEDFEMPDDRASPEGAPEAAEKSEAKAPKKAEA